ncbi:UDPglucose 6-dehydrogenase [Thermosulfidibacter takaii ABI70S6]|uniref:UDP-glucose 6-dehydrogenase n=1 Tax=Thermosulfidibacter takaii (strain DSM 17441 / JCM 13301 / NBRC 103674 / ABI70S6) TaxID=1298851 RepID=A0A0S3QSH1_THET7|nr:UDP-glucose/GDP-mannose dehydrogenase family protein [Thermosulfidibacter takaii]BAT71288.1 UDPglucose 6-dehydrogenase [Thermosulfidibacter takaii ABI70S6]
MKIAVIGAGYVGLVTATCFAEFGNEVVCVDKVKEKVEMLQKGEIPFYEPGLSELVKRNLSEGRLSFTQDIDSAIRDSLVIFIAVGTPPRGDGSADLTYVEEVAKKIAENLNDYKVVVTKSTVPVGTGHKIKEIIEKNKKNNVSFDVASNPEFLREGSAVYDFMHPDRVVIGTESDSARAILRDLYRPLYLRDTPFVFTDIKTAELIKYASNSYLAMRISFINEIANLCDIVGADVHVVAKAMGLDGRIGPKFLHPGPGFGGSCFPKDTKALIKIAEEHGYDFRLVKATVEVNEKQRERAFKKIKNMLGGSVEGKTVAVLGLSFKPNTDDIRESPALHIIERLLEEKAKVRAYDPAAMENVKKVFGDSIIYCKNSYDAATGADAVVIVTEWNQFRNMNLAKVKDAMAGDAIIDLRNIFEPEKVKALGFRYTGMGRN